VSADPAPELGASRQTSAGRPSREEFATEHGDRSLVHGHGVAVVDRHLDLALPPVAPPAIGAMPLWARVLIARPTGAPRIRASPGMT
jgi:hypothetical protein